MKREREREEAEREKERAIDMVEIKILLRLPV